MTKLRCFQKKLEFYPKFCSFLASQNSICAKIKKLVGGNVTVIGSFADKYVITQANLKTLVVRKNLRKNKIELSGTIIVGRNSKTI